MARRFPKYRVDGNTDFTADLHNKILDDLDARLHTLEEQKKTVDSVVNDLTAKGLQRINEALAPAYADLAQAANLGTLFTSTSVTSLEVVSSGNITFIIDESQRRRFAPGAWLAISVTGDPATYMVGQKVSYDAETGTLVLSVSHSLGSGTYDAWTISHTALPEALQIALASISVTHLAADVIAVLNSKSDVGHGHSSGQISGLGNLAVLNTVGSSRIDDNSITVSKIPDSTIVAAKIADGNVVSSKLGNGSVTLTKMQSGTQGDVYYCGASGAPSRLGAGKNGQALLSGGPSANPSWGIPVGARINFDRTSNTTRDSFNISSVTDHGVGDHQFSFTNAFANANYSTSAVVGMHGSGASATEMSNSAYWAVGSHRWQSWIYQSAKYDDSYSQGTYMGVLA